MIDSLIEQAETLKSEPYRSPAIKLWTRRAREFVETTYGEGYAAILNDTLRFRRIIGSEAQGNAMHVAAMESAITLLHGLRDEPTIVPLSREPPAGLHPAIRDNCMPLFDDGHYAEAVERSYKVVRDNLRRLTGHETGSEAFGKGKLRIAGAAAPHVADDFNEGVKFLTMAIDKFRNEKSHSSDGHTSDPERAREYLSLSSLAMHLLDQAEPSQ